MAESVPELPEKGPRMIDQRDDPGDPKASPGRARDEPLIASRVTITRTAHQNTVRRLDVDTYVYAHWAPAVGHDFPNMEWEDLLTQSEWRFVADVKRVDCQACLEWIRA